MPSGRGVVSIVLTALLRASATVRQTVWWLMGGSAVMIVLQVWDVWGRWGPQGIAELLSVLAAVAGILLLGLVSAIGAGSAAFSAAEDDDLRPVLVALPQVAFVAGTLIAAAIAFVVARGLLGIHQMRVVGMSAMLLFALLLAWITVRDTTRLLFAHAERRGTQVARARAELADARIAALQARMQPHFLFNALNTIAELVRTDARAAEATVEDLSSILRAVLKQSEAPFRPLREELAVARAYVGVEERRLGKRLTAIWRCPPDLDDLQVPAWSVQPLVENAIKYGVGSRIEGGTVRIETLRSGQQLTVSVKDDGDGFAEGWTEGTGLGSLRQRLASLYGESATLAIDPRPVGGVTFAVPLRREG